MAASNRDMLNQIKLPNSWKVNYFLCLYNLFAVNTFIYLLIDT